MYCTVLRYWNRKCENRRTVTRVTVHCCNTRVTSRYLWHRSFSCSIYSHIISIHRSKIGSDKNISKTKFLHETYSILRNKYLNYRMIDASSLVKVFWEQPQAYKEYKKKPIGNLPTSSGHLKLRNCREKMKQSYYEGWSIDRNDV